ncbi:protein spaetzle 3 [Sipha flava]|uniref:Protein spaetzle 3 n=1 Tax=Sipha flava TaxID=143950 RepID=A0A2S2Q4H9_9HEMI|nr:protein spaetzle 3 [Sipha flava]
MISSFQNFSGTVPPPLYSHPTVYDPVRGQHQLHPAYSAVAAAAAAAAAAQRSVFTASGQRPVPYHQQEADYGPSPYTPPSRRYESDRSPVAVATPDPPNRKNAPQQPLTPIQYTRVQGGVSGGKTSIHAVLDYDDDIEEENIDYYEDTYSHRAVTPIQGPIFLRNGSVPVVPLYGYQKVSNGSLLQIPVFWTTLSFALGYEIGGDVIRGTPCIKKNHQLFCPTAGKSYPVDRIDRFIDENKALMKRMYGEFEMMENGPFPKAKRSTARKRRQDSSFSDNQSKPNKLPTRGQPPDSGRIDSCESKVEVVTPYWASNSVGKTRAIVNTEHFEQAIHQEVCTKMLTGRCSGDCGCEQKYKWHRLLAYDPDNDCKGIFMDWFLFPSCCVCRCDSTAPNNV